MKILIYLITAFIIFIAISININLEAKYDLVKNIGKLKLKIFKFIPIYSVNVSLAGGYIKLIKHKKVKQVKIEINNKTFLYFKEFGKCVKTKRYLTVIRADYNIALKRPDLCAIIAGNLKMITRILLAKVKAAEVDVKVLNNTNVAFTDTKLEVYFNYQFLITIFDVIWAAMIALIRVRRIYGNKKQTKRCEK